MPSTQNPGSVLEAMEKGTDEVQDAEGVIPAGVENTRNGKL